MAKRGGSGGGGKRRTSLPISNYFSKRPKTPECSPVVTVPEGGGEMPSSSSSHSHVDAPVSAAACVDSPSSVEPTIFDSPDTSAQSVNNVVSTSASCSNEDLPLPQPTVDPSQPQPHQYDIGIAVGKTGDFDDFSKAKLLQETWTPTRGYKFPFSVHTKNGKEVRRYVGAQHLETHHWLALSDQDKGLYCKYCVLFAPETAGRGTHESLNALVKKPVTSFSKLYGKDGILTTHEGKKYHKDAVEKSKNFLLTYHLPSLEVANQVNAQRLAKVKENRARLRPIVETVIFCGRQNIALRGHRDDGRLMDVDKAEVGSVVSNEGNFRSLLRFRIAAGDSELEDHLKTASSNATYIRKNTQNEIINFCGDEITEQLCERVRKAHWFAVIFDETTDGAHKEQLSLSLRYVHKGSIREDFFTFLDCYEAIRPEDIADKGEKRLTGVALGRIVIDLCSKFNLDLEHKCVGVGTDNCSVNASTVKGAIQEIQKGAPLAVRCPCMNHMLNNSLKQSNQVLACKTTVSKMKEVIGFSNASAKLSQVFVKHMGRSFSGLCETRWQEKHDGVLQFCHNLPNICNALKEISQWASETAGKAYSLLKSLCDGEFIVTTFALCEILAATRPLSLLLQTVSLDYVTATDAVKDVNSVLERKRSEVDACFKETFLKATKLADEIDVEISSPRAARRQLYRANPPSENAEEYFKRAVFIPMLDFTITDLKDRFSAEVMESFNLRLLLLSAMSPGNRIPSNEVLEKIRALGVKYTSALGENSFLLESEYALWYEKWHRVRSEKGFEPSTAIETLEACDADMFPNINTLITILATLPVSVATAERSFSTLRRLKTWLRTRMSQDRLNGLALLHIHQDIPCSVGKVIDRFAKTGNRRKELIL